MTSIMKKLAYIFLVLFMAACNGSEDNVMPNDEYPNSHWGKPYIVTEYQDATGKEVFETTTYYYDFLDRMTGYLRVNRDGSHKEEMLNSLFDDRTHTYEVHSWEWIGGTLPVVFYYTDTYTDTSFSTIEKRYMKTKSMDWEETVTYRYENGRQAGYRTVVEGQYPDDFETRITYHNDLRPSAKLFPQEVENKADRVEMVYIDGYGDRTGYYSDNDYVRAQWNFNYGNGYCTYYTCQFGNIDQPRLVRLFFYPNRNK
jgi:hypothetical protein